MAEALTTLAASTVTLSAPLVLAALGGFASERAGVINIALEGLMLAAACAAALGGIALGNPWLGLLAALAAATLLSMLHALLTQAYRLDHVVSGMAINALAIGGTSFADKRFTDVASSAEIPQLPLWIYYALALAIPLLAAGYLKRTRGGLRLLAVGNDPHKAAQMAVDPVRVRYAALAVAGVLCGLSGALIVTNAGRFTDGMTAGRGFIALAALILGGWRPLQTLLACVVFGFFEALQLQLQGMGGLVAGLPSQVWNMLPYLAVLVAIAGMRGRSHMPAALGRREE